MPRQPAATTREESRRLRRSRDCGEGLRCISANSRVDYRRPGKSENGHKGSPPDNHIQTVISRQFRCDLANEKRYDLHIEA
jgi:hypothetical protein